MLSDDQLQTWTVSVKAENPWAESPIHLTERTIKIVNVSEDVENVRVFNIGPMLKSLDWTPSLTDVNEKSTIVLYSP